MTGPETRTSNQDVGHVPVGQLVSQLSEDLSPLVRSELALAKLETKQEMTKAGKAGGILGGAAVAGWHILRDRPPGAPRLAWNRAESGSQ